jgi:hypothetical protein
MNTRLYTIENTPEQPLEPIQQLEAINALEQAQVLFFPKHSFHSPIFSQGHLWTEATLDATHKNISYHYPSERLGKINKSSLNNEVVPLLQGLMHRYAEYAKNLIDKTLPEYSDALLWGRTSFRPAQINQRVSSKRKDDTRLHVDSFSATPVYGNRILRVFANVNPYNEPRIWHLGEPFNEVLARFAPGIPKYQYLAALFLKAIKTTKTLRSPYDHYQIYLHDRMKRDDHYQQTVTKQKVEFPANSTWVVFTDQVSHAALSGQFLLEQTFYLPVAAMKDPTLSPLNHWDNIKPNVQVKQAQAKK